jgi:TIR domain
LADTPERYDIFLSYCHADTNVAEAFIRCAGARNLKVWYDRFIDGGENWRVEIVEALERSTVVLILFSATSNKSLHLIREVAIADRIGKPVIPIRIENAEPTGAYLYELALRHWIDLHPDPLSGMDAVVMRLARQIRDGGLPVPSGRVDDPPRNPAPVPHVTSPDGVPSEAPNTSTKPRGAASVRWVDVLVMGVIFFAGGLAIATETRIEGVNGVGVNFIAIILYLLVVMVRNARQIGPPPAMRRLLGYGLVWLLTIPFAAGFDKLLGMMRENFIEISFVLLLFAPCVAAICGTLEFVVRRLIFRRAFRERIAVAGPLTSRP